MEPSKDLFSLPKEKNSELTVTELSIKIKRTIETNFDFVKVKGEISGIKIAPSGHLYFSIKDNKSVLSAVCWRSNVNNLKCKPEEGMEVTCIGQVTTYAGQSKYQIIVSSIEHSGIGSLMAILEKRKKLLSAEGLFDARHKKHIPMLPKTIGVVTSLGGAVIKDIIHRVNERCPCRIIVWPVLVQGPESSQQVSDAITGFNALKAENKPDVIIVARGGGSIEDLWSFNEENVVRAAFDSNIPIISAVGHETDYTLIDLVSDKRAPTPTAAAEMAVPVKRELDFTLNEIEHRLMNSTAKYISNCKNEIKSLSRALPNLNKISNEIEQRLDDLQLRLIENSKRFIEIKFNEVKMLASRNATPQHYLSHKTDTLKHEYSTLRNLIKNFVSEKQILMKATSSLFDSYSYEKTLSRGFSLVKDSKDKIIKSSSELAKNKDYYIQFSKGISKVTSAE